MIFIQGENICNVIIKCISQNNNHYLMNYFYDKLIYLYNFHSAIKHKIKLRITSYIMNIYRYIC